MQNLESSTFSFLVLPAEIRSMIYALAFTNEVIHVSDPSLRRSIGGPNMPKHRRLPSLLLASKQIRKESLPTFAEQATLVFNDFFTFSQLVAVVPDLFAKSVRKLALRGEVVPRPSLSRFSALTQVTYHHLGHCFYAPTRENGYCKRASEASDVELVELAFARSSALHLLASAIGEVREVRKSKVVLMANTNVLSCHERMNVTINISRRKVVDRKILDVHHFYD